MAMENEAGVRYTIYSSDFAILEGQSNGFIDALQKSKRNIEHGIANAGFDTWTVIRPGYFMANFLLPKVNLYPGATEGSFTFAFPAATGLPLIDHEDIPKFTIVQNPVRFNEHTIRIAGEVLSTEEAIRLLSSAAKHNFRTVYLSASEVEERAKTDYVIQLQAGIPKMAGLMDMEEVKSWGVPFGSFRDFLTREKELV